MDELVQDFNNALDETAESTSSNRSGTTRINLPCDIQALILCLQVGSIQEENLEEKV